MRLRIFFIISIVIHVLIFTGIYFLPAAKEKKERLFSAKLVTPEEARPPAVQVPKPLPRPPVIPLSRPVPRPLPVPPMERSKVPVAPSRPFQLPHTSPEGPPVVPGEGSDTGRPLPEGQKPEKSAGRGTGEGGDTKPGIEPAKPGASSRSRLFDRAVTDAIARMDTAARPKKDEAITFDTTEYRYAGYMKKLKSKIESIWVYPPEAASKRIYGDLKIRFTINKDGRLGRVELVRTSGYKILDEAAMKALKDGEPYWPLPDDWDMESYTITGHFIYGLYGYQLR